MEFNMRHVKIIRRRPVFASEH